jgi:hypothetical protein
MGATAMPAIHALPASPMNGIRERLCIMKAARLFKEALSRADNAAPKPT